MATSWQLSGEYCETCSCDYVCPCLPSNLTARPTHGHCYFLFGFDIGTGRYGGVTLDGLKFAVVGYTPAVMVDGNWSIGLIVDERASAEQTEALTAIASGQAGGPLAALAPLIGKFLGVERKPIEFKKDGMRRSVSIPGALEQELAGVESPAKPGEPLYVDNTMHPVNARLALAHASRSRLSAFGLKWEDTSGKNNGHYAPFNWKN
ncbi:MAG TPA: DUF1326 domain-containing protein [Methylomirabilota bacterium]|nr:DUF1326 domain-containing protein [Methylomirabilota bacterium]